ncbi:hypothetical protein [Falsiroseomonas selenitidurans]|uniref:hypothetical protein n=1 Tax=Falsiroseomonas selenitidurans TaxID=2716335 RepID=UPI002E2996EF|nr:hypothetical protein [Falsiroseomonas selenitidurans]
MCSAPGLTRRHPGDNLARLTPRAAPTRAARSQQASLAAFLAQKARFDAMVAELQQMSDDHFGADPEAFLWARAETLAHWNSRLASVTDAYFKRGEFAA